LPQQVVFYVNGHRHSVQEDAVFQPLTDYLRYTICHTGTKVVCQEGDCGACTVLVGVPAQEADTLSYRAVNGCIQYLYQIQGCHVVTVEGLKSLKGLHPVQDAMIACHGAQCGYCTPGMVMALSHHFFERTHLQTNVPPTRAEIGNVLTGNLCRCTGYDSIIKAGCAVNEAEIPSLSELFPEADIARELRALRATALELICEEQCVLIPAALPEALQYRKDFPSAQVIAGGTDVHVVYNKRFTQPRSVISLALVSELSQIKKEGNQLTIGAMARLSDLETWFQSQWPEGAKLLNLFGSPQIKQVGTLAGNIANGSPIGDTLPFLFVLNAMLELTSVEGDRQIPINQFYTGYKQTLMKPHELITAIRFTLPAPQEYVKLYKVSKRSHLDISAFTAAFRFTLSECGIIQSMAIAYGGVGPTVARLSNTEAFLMDKSFTRSVMQEAGQLAMSEISPLDDVRGSRNYRLQLARNILCKLYEEFQNTAANQEAIVS